MGKRTLLCLMMLPLLLLSACGTNAVEAEQEPLPEVTAVQEDTEHIEPEEEQPTTTAMRENAPEEQELTGEGRTPMTEEERTALSEILVADPEFLTWLEWYDPEYSQPPLASFRNGWFDEDGRAHLEYRTWYRYPPDLYEAILEQDGDQWKLVSNAQAQGMTIEGEPEGTALTADELAQMEVWFWGKEDSIAPTMLHQYLTSPYRTPEEIDLFELFYNGCIDDQVWSFYTGASMEEQMAVLGHPAHTDLTKATTADMDASLRVHMGIGLEDTLGYCLEHMIYAPEYDAYYNEHGDTNSVLPEFSCGWRMEDGSLRLRYENFSKTMEVGLAPKEDGGWCFVYNLWVSP